MTDQPQQTKPNEYMYYPEDEKDLIDHLLVIWKWKYLIIAGTLAFAMVALITNFVSPKKYCTNILLKPGISGVNENGEVVLIYSPENLKTIIESDLKYKILDYIKNSGNKNLSASLGFKMDFLDGSRILNISLTSAYGDQDKTKLNYLIQSLTAEFENKIKFIKEKLDEEIELKKVALVNLMPMERKTRVYYNKVQQLNKDNTFDVIPEEQNIKKNIYYIQNRIAELESKIKLITDSNEWLTKKIDILKKDNSQDTTLPIFLCSRTIIENISAVEKYSDQIQANYDQLNKIDIVEKEIEKLEKKKLNFQNIQVIQPPDTTALPKTNRKVISFSVVVFFMMILLAFFMEYLKKNKYKLKK